jgi:hypothetical protein
MSIEQESAAVGWFIAQPSKARSFGDNDNSNWHHRGVQTHSCVRYNSYAWVVRKVWDIPDVDHYKITSSRYRLVYMLNIYIVTHRPIARQRLGKHIPEEYATIKDIQV